MRCDSQKFTSVELQMLNKSSLLKGKDPPVPVSFDMQIITLDLNKQAEFESLTAPGVTTRILMLENKKKVQKKKYYTRTACISDSQGKSPRLIP